MVLDEEEELLGDAKDPGWLVPWEEPAVSLVPASALHLKISFGNYLIVYISKQYEGHTIFILIILPYNPLRQVISNIVVERVRKGLWSSVEVVVRATLQKGSLDAMSKEMICPNKMHHAFCHLKDSCSR